VEAWKSWKCAKKGPAKSMDSHILCSVRGACCRPVWPNTAVLLPHWGTDVLHPDRISEWLLHAGSGWRWSQEAYRSANVSTNHRFVKRSMVPISHVAYKLH